MSGQDKKRPGSGGDNSPELGKGGQERKTSNVEDTLKKLESTVNHVTYGANDLDLDLTGLTIEEIQTSLAGVLSVDATAEAYVNGEKVSKSRKLQKGERLEFMKEAGQKG